MTRLTLLIADDEAIERNTMSQFIKKNFAQIDRVELATNGFELIEKAELYRPDIMLVDVEMPGMNGLDSIAALRKKGITSRTIIYSAYNQFEYAQEAIFLDVSAYILKPARRQDLIKIINDAAEQALEDKKKNDMNLHNDQIFSTISPILQIEFIRSIILDDLDSETMAVCLHLLTIPFSNGCMITLALDDNQITSTKIRASIREQIPFEANLVVGPLLHGQCSLYIQFSGIDSNEKLLGLCQDWATSLIRYFKTMLAINVQVGIGLPCRHLADLPASYQQSLSTINSPSGLLSVTNDPFIRNREYLQSLLMDGNEQKLTAILEKIFEDMRASAATNFACQQMVRDFLMRSWQEIKFKTETSTTLQDFIGFPLENIAQQKNLPELIAWTQALMHRFVSFMKSNQQESGISHVRAAREYINEHYMDTITLDTVADQIGISPFYLSHLFKSEMDMTFLQYVTKYRMHQAVMIQQATGLPLEQVAARVGYQSSAYFKRIFSQYNTAPREILK